MRNFLFLLALLFSSSAAFCATPTIELQVDNTSGLSDEQALAELSQVLSDFPEYRGEVISLSVGSATAVLDLTLRVETIGMKETIKPSQWSADVGGIIKSATGGISGSASVKVDVHHKSKDGSETTVKVEITVTGKK